MSFAGLKVTCKMAVTRKKVARNRKPKPPKGNIGGIRQPPKLTRAFSRKAINESDEDAISDEEDNEKVTTSDSVEGEEDKNKNHDITLPTDKVNKTNDSIVRQSNRNEKNDDNAAIVETNEAEAKIAEGEVAEENVVSVIATAVPGNNVDADTESINNNFNANSGEAENNINAPISDANDKDNNIAEAVENIDSVPDAISVNNVPVNANTEMSQVDNNGNSGEVITNVNANINEANSNEANDKNNSNISDLNDDINVSNVIANDGSGKLDSSADNENESSATNKGGNGTTIIQKDNDAISTHNLQLSHDSDDDCDISPNRIMGFTKSTNPVAGTENNVLRGTESDTRGELSSQKLSTNVIQTNDTSHLTAHSTHLEPELNEEASPGNKRKIVVDGKGVLSVKKGKIQNYELGTAIREKYNESVGFKDGEDSGEMLFLQSWLHIFKNSLYANDLGGSIYNSNAGGGDDDDDDDDDKDKTFIAGRVHDVAFLLSPGVTGGYNKSLMVYTKYQSVHVPYHAFSLRKTVEQLYNFAPLHQVSSYTFKSISDNDTMIECEPLLLVFPIGFRCGIKVRLPGCQDGEFTLFKNDEGHMVKDLKELALSFLTSCLVEDSDKVSCQQQVLNASIICIVFPQTFKSAKLDQDLVCYHIAAMCTFRISKDGACIDFIRTCGFNGVYRNPHLKCSDMDYLNVNSIAEGQRNFQHRRLSCLLIAVIQDMCETIECEPSVYMQLDFRYYAFQVFLNYGFRQSEVHYNHQHYPLCMDKTNVYPKHLAILHNNSCNTYTSLTEYELTKIVETVTGGKNKKSKWSADLQVSAVYDELCQRHEGCARIIILPSLITVTYPALDTFRKEDFKERTHGIANWIFSYGLPIPRCDYAPYSKYSGDRLLTVFAPFPSLHNDNETNLTSNSKIPALNFNNNVGGQGDGFTLTNSAVIHDFLDNADLKCNYMGSKYVNFIYKNKDRPIDVPVQVNPSDEGIIYYYPEQHAGGKSPNETLVNDKASVVATAVQSYAKANDDKTNTWTAEDFRALFLPLSKPSLDKNEKIIKLDKNGKIIKEVGLDSFYTSLLSLFYGGNSFSSTTFSVIELKLCLIAVIHRIKKLQNKMMSLEKYFDGMDGFFNEGNVDVLLEALESSIYQSFHKCIPFQLFREFLVSNMLCYAIPASYGGPMAFVKAYFLRPCNNNQLSKKSINVQQRPVQLYFDPPMNEWDNATMFIVHETTSNGDGYSPFFMALYTDDTKIKKSRSVKHIAMFDSLPKVVKKASIRARENETINLSQQRNRVTTLIPPDSQFKNSDCYRSEVDYCSDNEDDDDILMEVTDPDDEMWEKMPIETPSTNGKWIRLSDCSNKIYYFVETPFSDTNDQAEKRKQILDKSILLPLSKCTRNMRKLNNFNTALIDKNWRIKSLKKGQCLELTRLDFQPWYIQFLTCYCFPSALTKEIFIGFIPYYNEVPLGLSTNITVKWIPFILPEAYVAKYFREELMVRCRHDLGVLFLIEPGKPRQDETIESTALNNLYEIYSDENFVIKYKQYNTFNCAFYSLLSALFYTKHRSFCEHLLKIYCHKKMTMKQSRHSDILHIICSTINKGLKKCYLKRIKNRCSIRRNYAQIKQSDNIHLIILRDNNGAANHAVSVTQALIFDASRTHALHLTESNLAQCCEMKMADIDKMYELQEL